MQRLYDSHQSQKLSELTARELGVLFSRLRADTEGLAEFEAAICVGPNFGPPWYRSQKEHMIGWVADYEGPGAYQRKPKVNPSAASVYMGLNCAPALVWIYGALNIPRDQWRPTVDEISKGGAIGRMARACGALRKAVPWSVIEQHLRLQTPVSKEEWRAICGELLAARTRLRERAYGPAAHRATDQHEREKWTPMNIDTIVATLPDKTPAQREVMRVNAKRWLTEGSETQKSAASNLLTALDTLEEEERLALNAKIAATPLTERVRNAFAKRPPSETETTLLRVLLAHPKSTSAELTSHMGWEGQSAWHMHFGTMCKQREADLWPADPASKRDGNFYSGILADLDKNGNVFEAKAELVEVLRELAG